MIFDSPGIMPTNSRCIDSLLSIFGRLEMSVGIRRFLDIAAVPLDKFIEPLVEPHWVQNSYIFGIQAVHNHDLRKSALAEHQTLGNSQEGPGRRCRPFGGYQPQRCLQKVQHIDRGISLVATPNRPARHWWSAHYPDSAVPRGREKPLEAEQRPAPIGRLLILSSRAEWCSGMSANEL